MVGPREIMLEVRKDGQNLGLIEKALQNSRIRFEIVSNDPIRIKLPATTRAVSVLLLLLNELKPVGSIILDNGSTYGIDEEGLCKLRRIAIRSLSNGAPVKEVVEIKPQKTEPIPEAVSTVKESNSTLPQNPSVVETAESHGFKSSQVSSLTMMFALLIGVAATFETVLAILGKIGGAYSIFILGACIIGTFSVMHRYASAFKIGTK